MTAPSQTRSRLQMLLVALSLVLMLSLVNAHGAQASAAYSAALQLWTYVQMPAMAIGAACSTSILHPASTRRGPCTSASPRPTTATAPTRRR